MASTYLSKTFTAGNTKKWTWSCWFKKSSTPATWTALIEAGSGSQYFTIGVDGSERLILASQDEGAGGVMNVWSSQVIRDLSGWYHYVVAYDSAQATASDRVKGYINGEQITSFNTANYPTQNKDTYLNGAYEHRIGRRISGTYYDGLMSHIHFIDGTAYDASAFGETDANGVWTIKTSPSVTYGTNGFFILKDGNSVTDQSGNGNNFTVAGGTLTNTEDSPSNVFATLNPLNQNPSNQFVLQNGNLSVANSTAVGTKNHGSSTLGVSSGKWYCEFKVDSGSYFVTGVSYDPSELARNNQDCGYYSSGWGYYQALGTVRNNDSGSAYGNSLTTGDILGIALDLDNSKLYFAKNGVWQNSGDPTSGATGTGAVSITSGQTYFFVTGDADGTSVTTTSANFGNGYFGTTAVASAGTNASGNGIFEYDVPTGYTALCTKGLNGE